ncbi:MAG: sigma-54 dependent transcriptional regulator [Anaeromyxobacter sp.]
MARVLVVDDQSSVLYALELLLRSRGHEAVLARSASEALAALPGRVDAVISDYAMPGMDGLKLLQAAREVDPGLPIVMVTAHGSERVAVAAMKAGAYDYVAKPFDSDELMLVVERALETRELRLQNRRLVAERTVGRTIVGESLAMQRLLRTAERIAARDITVLVRGETGTGKELVAALLHAASGRAQGPLVRFNCAAIPPDLADAELFGHARGAFTGAAQSRRGFFSEASGGTLVLDEIGELPLAVQPKLLRALQDGEIQPVGAGRVERVDVRVVACTNRDLAEEVRAGRFREDLYFRLAVMELTVPPLRDRREDIPALASELARRYADRFGLGAVRLAPALLERLKGQDWPGNVRELENTIARLVALGGEGELGPEALAGAPDAGPEGAPATPSAEGSPSLREQVRAFERGVIARALEATGGNQAAAARLLGVSRSALFNRLRALGLRS